MKQGCPVDRSKGKKEVKGEWKEVKCGRSLCIFHRFHRAFGTHPFSELRAVRVFRGQFG